PVQRLLRPPENRRYCRRCGPAPFAAARLWGKWPPLSAAPVALSGVPPCSAEWWRTSRGTAHSWGERAAFAATRPARCGNRRADAGTPPAPFAPRRPDVFPAVSGRSAGLPGSVSGAGTACPECASAASAGGVFPPASPWPEQWLHRDYRHQWPDRWAEFPVWWPECGSAARAAYSG